MKFTLEEVLAVNGHTPADTPTAVKNNLIDLLARVNKLGYPLPARCTSGYRDPKYNRKIRGAKKSAHCTGRAIDIADPDKEIKHWILEHEHLLEELGLRMESEQSAPTWCHLDTMPVRHRRVFWA